MSVQAPIITIVMAITFLLCRIRRDVHGRVQKTTPFRTIPAALLSQGFAPTGSSFDFFTNAAGCVQGVQYFLNPINMNKTTDRQRNLEKTRFDEEVEIIWEHAFNKFGFGDGAYGLTYLVVDALEELGYTAEEKSWGFHNDIITSIKKNDREIMPIDDPNIGVGYSDPRTYLPVELIRALDERYYGW